MYYRLKKEMPKHEFGDVLYLNEEKGIYDWVEPPNYPLFKTIVESDEQNFFESFTIDIKENDKIYYLDVCGEIVESNFKNFNHLKLFLNDRIFKSLEMCEKAQEKINNLYKDIYDSSNDNDNDR